MCDHIMHLNLITYHLTVCQKNFPEDWCGSINPIPNNSLLFLSMYLPIYLSITHHEVLLTWSTTLVDGDVVDITYI